KTANLAGGVVRTHWNGLAHGKPPQFAILNHAAIDSGIPRESATQRLGISFSSNHRLLIGELHLGKLSETVVVHGNAPHDRPRFLVNHLIGNRARFLCTKAPMRRVPESGWHS